jgi:hypothetical protein
MATYTVTLTDAEDKAIHVVAKSAQEWINNAVHNRCRIAIDEIVNNYIQAQLSTGQPIVGSTHEEIVLNSNVKSLAQIEAELNAQTTKVQG